MVVKRTRADYKRGIPCSECGTVIRSGSPRSMTCIVCSGEVCLGCAESHEKRCAPLGALDGQGCLKPGCRAEPMHPAVPMCPGHLREAVVRLAAAFFGPEGF